jgi:hypothetical protein
MSKRCEPHCEDCGTASSQCGDPYCVVGWIHSMDMMFPCSKCLPEAARAWMSRDDAAWSAFCRVHYEA